MKVSALFLGLLLCVAPLWASSVYGQEAAKVDAVPKTPEQRQQRIKDLIKALGDETTRLPAQQELEKYGEEAIPKLIEALAGRKTTAHASVILKKIGAPAYKALGLAMRDENRRNAAAALLEKVGAPAIPVLMEELEHIKSRLRAGKALERIGDPTVPALINALWSPVDRTKGRSGWVTVRVIDALAKIGTPRVINALLAALEEKPIRSSAEICLGKIGKPAHAGIRTKALKSKTPAVRSTGIRLLYRARAEGSFEPILAMFNDSEASVRREVAYACREFRRKEAVPKLVVALKDKDKDVRAASLAALVAIPDGRALSALVDAMRDENLRMTAASAIEAMGASATDTLLKLARHREEEIRWQALDALIPLKDVRAIPFFIQGLKLKSRRFYLTSASGLRMLGKPSTPALIQLLKSPKAGERKRAADVLFSLKDYRAMDPLVAALKDPDAEVREASARALTKLKDSRIVPALLAAMKDPNEDVRYQIGRVLAAVADVRTVPALVNAMKDPRIHMSILTAMGRIGKAAEPALVAALSHKNRHLRSQSARSLGRIGIKKAPSPLMQSLKDPEIDVRKYAAESLGKIGDKAATPALIAAAKDKERVVRYNVIDALISIQDPRAIATLIEAMSDDATRISAMSALTRIGREAVPPLLSALKSAKEDKLRRAIIGVLEDLDDPRTVVALIEALSDEKVRQIAALSLGRIGKVAVPRLVVALTDKNGSRRIGAAVALRDIADPGALDAMIKAMDDTEALVREGIAEGLGIIGPGASKSVPRLSKLLFDEVDDVRYHAAISLGLIGDPRAVPDLIKASSDDDVDLVAIRAVQKIGDKATEAIIAGLQSEAVDSRSNTITIIERLNKPVFVMPLVKSLQSDKEARIREEAARALGYLGDKRATAALAKATTEDEDWTVRQAAALSIGDIGDPAGAPALVQALADEEFGVTWNAQRSLERIGVDGTLEILKQMDNEDPDVRSRAVKALINLRDERAIPALIKALGDDDGFVRRDSCIALGNIGEPSVILALAKSIKEDPSKSIRYRGVEAIGKIWDRTPDKLVTKWKVLSKEHEAKEETAFGVLVASLSEVKWEVRMHAIRAMGNMGNPKTITHLVSSLADKHSKVSGEAVSSLKKFPRCDTAGPVAPGSLVSL
ncbi:MAG: HEAT repeat domain-containing protein, partial [Planctomycetia bacterium]|nr:HEAT repeat domain-containing protein [Planctomycetia bacterium]